MRVAPVLFSAALPVFAGLRAQTDATFPAEAAARFAQLALDCVHREYPNKISHVLQSVDDVAQPSALTPAFYGCFDWHSSVHGHWLLARLARTYPEASFAEAARTFEGQGVTFVGINVEDNEDDAREFTVDTPYRSIVDKDGTLLAQIPDIPPRSLPVTVILDRDGRVAVQIVGPIVLGTLEDTIASVIASEA